MEATIFKTLHPSTHHILKVKGRQSNRAIHWKCPVKETRKQQKLS